jgi:hypothetical protein
VVRLTREPVARRAAEEVTRGLSREGERIGPYRIVREVGRGSMGAVFLAERADSQFEKRVALKLLRRGRESEQALRRFLTERRILSRLEHAGIARMLDGGSTPDGLPYFVMDAGLWKADMRQRARASFDAFGRPPRNGIRTFDEQLQVRALLPHREHCFERLSDSAAALHTCSNHQNPKRQRTRRPGWLNLMSPPRPA